MINVTRVNHLVLFVADLPGMASFYQTHLGLEIAETLEDTAVFLRVPGSQNHHDLGLIALPGAEPPGRPVTGLYHFAWEVAELPDLVEARTHLAEAGLLVGQSDHGTSLSLYAKDPEGNEFEIFWPVPEEEWDRRGFGVWELRLDAELDLRIDHGASESTGEAVDRSVAEA